jgi:hypothetical protein
MKSRLLFVVFLILVFSSCRSLRFSNRYEAYSVKFNSVSLSVDNSKVSVTPVIYGNRNEFSVLSVQTFLGIEVARLLLHNDSAFLIDRINKKIYIAGIPKSSISKLEELLLSKDTFSSLVLPVSKNQNIDIQSQSKANSREILFRFNNYSFNAVEADVKLKNDKFTMPDLPRSYEKIPFVLP